MFCLSHFAQKISCTCMRGVLPVLFFYAFRKLISSTIWSRFKTEGKYFSCKQRFYGALYRTSTKCPPSVFTMQPYGGYHNVSGPLSQLRIGQYPVVQNLSLLEKNVTSGSQQVVTDSYQQQGLSTEYREPTGAPYIRANSP